MDNWTVMCDKQFRKLFKLTVQSTVQHIQSLHYPTRTSSYSGIDTVMYTDVLASDTHYVALLAQHHDDQFQVQNPNLQPINPVVKCREDLKKDLGMKGGMLVSLRKSREYGRTGIDNKQCFCSISLIQYLQHNYSIIHI